MMQKNGSEIIRAENDKVRSIGFSGEASLAVRKSWTGTFGFETYYDYVRSKRTDSDIITEIVTERRGLYPDRSLLNSFAAFSVNTFDLGKWILTAGARFNTFTIKVDDETLGETSLTPTAIVGNLAILRRLGKTSNLFISLNSGFRTPNIDDLGTLGIVDFRYETPDFNLKPEKSIQYQTGYKFQSSRLRGLP
jgi:outer membrane receptor protein involved in Fe transport